jgi:Flp pilus assembly pilin Flp
MSARNGITSAGRRRQLLSLREYAGDDCGQSATEYILVIGLIIVPLAIAFNELADVLKALLIRIGNLMYGPGV